MRRALDLIARAAPADTPVLILGESGTGKELLARALHAAGPRRDRAVHGGELLGHPRDPAREPALRPPARRLHRREGGPPRALPGGRGRHDPARRDRRHGPSLQAKLLRVLQEREVHPLGAAAPVAVDVRVIAATNRDLEALCAAGPFPAGPLLPAQRHHDPRCRRCASAPRTCSRWSPTSCGSTASGWDARDATVSLEAMELFRRHAVAGQRAGAGERDRAGAGAGLGPHDPRRGPPRRPAARARGGRPGRTRCGSWRRSNGSRSSRRCARGERQQDRGGPPPGAGPQDALPQAGASTASGSPEPAPRSAPPGA